VDSSCLHKINSGIGLLARKDREYAMNYFDYVDELDFDSFNSMLICLPQNDVLNVLLSNSMGLGRLRRLTVFTIELLIGFTLIIGFLEDKQHKPHFIIIYNLIRNL
jgi:hypothetical protein